MQKYSAQHYFCIRIAQMNGQLTIADWAQLQGLSGCFAGLDCNFVLGLFRKNSIGNRFFYEIVAIIRNTAILQQRCQNIAPNTIFASMLHK